MNKEIAGGIAMMVFAALYAYSASDLSMTSSLGLGPGLFPMALACILAALGGSVALTGLLAARCGAGAPAEQATEDPIPYRALILITLAPIVFAVLVTPLGVLPALAIAVFASAMSSNETTLRGALIVSLVMAVVTVTLFRWGLGLPIQPFGPIFNFLNLGR